MPRSKYLQIQKANSRDTFKQLLNKFNLAIDKLDLHDHEPTLGKKISPRGITIDEAFNLNDFGLSRAKYVNLSAVQTDNLIEIPRSSFFEKNGILMFKSRDGVDRFLGDVNNPQADPASFEIVIVLPEVTNKVVYLTVQDGLRPIGFYYGGTGSWEFIDTEGIVQFSDITGIVGLSQLPIIPESKLSAAVKTKLNESVSEFSDITGIVDLLQLPIIPESKLSAEVQIKLNTGGGDGGASSFSELTGIATLPQLPIIPESKLSAAVQTKLNTGGGVDSGIVFPTNPTSEDLFVLKVDIEDYIKGLYCYNGATWDLIASVTTSGGITPDEANDFLQAESGDFLITEDGEFLEFS